MVATRQQMSEAEFAAIDEPGRFDLVDGEVWSMPPAHVPHGRYALRVVDYLLRYNRDSEHGEILIAETGFELQVNPRTILCPDVAFVRRDRWVDPPQPGFFRGGPDLAVEVISDSERPREIQLKVARYLGAGTAVVWCLYPGSQQVVVYTQTDPPRTFHTEDTLTLGSVLPGFELPLSALFA
jgi:Uma2 family endonuclease